MDGEELECIDPERGAEIEQIEMSGGDPGELAPGYHQDDPGFLGALADHWSACESCQIDFPGAMNLVSAIREAAARMALHRIEDLAAEFAGEFPEGSLDTKNDQRHAEQIAALASNYSARLSWELSFLLPRPSWQDFTLAPSTAEVGKNQPQTIAACEQHLHELPAETLRFVFITVLTGEMYINLFNKFWRMSLPTLFREKPAGEGFECFDNLEYPIYQAYELRALASLKLSGREPEGDLLYGSPILLEFIREKLQETLLEWPVNYRILHTVLEHSASAFLRKYKEDGTAAADTSPLAVQPGISAEIRDIHSELSDGIDSLRAGQMEIRLAIERNRRSADAFLPLVETRLGRVYGQIHQTTKRLLARGEYFRSNNQAEPDAMNPVVIDQAKACEHELYMRVFGPYLMRLLADGVMDYLVNGICKNPLLKRGKEVPRNMALANYCWYLKHDSRLQEWIESTLKLPLPKLIDEAYWISDQRNLAAHENDYKEHNLAIFQQRLFGPTGLLSCLHPRA